ncbi:alpha/beta hydrolase [Blastococcus haudaquaticus]|uniref:Pimeloyl-ACP methyl ester carboxylesterase n=1 Tax=Blastococcus haudaquaticus TaxID=1938745 RepID=A0A286GSR1_9ACTN|nr:alpha/beta fold hydrolase [Blastococcus haudaquaticus]SOD98109.1 Pimeloyl-ACP methyl ester carboxylesterase [Blastococcus haudaquaticus]
MTVPGGQREGQTARVGHAPSRARDPDVQGMVERDGVRLAYEVFGQDHSPTVLLMPSWSIVHSGHWKAQVGYLARRYRVVTFDGRGSGASGRPVGAAAYTDDQYAADAVAVLDATGTERAVLVGLSCGATWSVHVAAGHPDRVLGLFALAPSCGFPLPPSKTTKHEWNARLDEYKGWERYNRHFWLEEDYDAFLRFFFDQMYGEPHSTKQIEDGLGWGREVSAETLVDTTAGRIGCDGAVCVPVEPLCRRVRCPVVVVHGTRDRIRPHAIGKQLADLTGGSLVLLEGSGHGPHARDPVKVNHLIADFVDRVVPRPGRTTWTRAPARPKRALYLSSPIGLGHALRDVAVAEELRLRHPDLRIDWLAQHPVTRVLEGRGEAVHPASAELANESGHVEHESGEHDLHAFQAIRRMDEILVNNFMVFDDVVAGGDYDLVIGDEAWDVDHFLHENPELKRFAFAWMTDFVGWLPMPEGGAAEAALTADYNAEMIAQRARFRRVRDRSVFVGSPGDIVDADLGPGLPPIREWTEQNFDFAGYVTGFDPSELTGIDELRWDLGVGGDEKLCLVTVGGSGVGGPLLRRVLDAVPRVRDLVPELRFLVVTGPRIDPASLPGTPGVRVVGYLPELYRHLAACDIAVVQGGLTTCMELTALRKPFVYVPLRNHFEQNHHVRHRLDRYGAGRCLAYDDVVDADALAEAIAKEVTREVAYRPVETDGARRAAALLADLL